MSELMGGGTQNLELTPEGTARLLVPTPGRVTLTLRLAGDRSRARATVELDTIDLSEVADGQVFSVEVDPTELEAALAKVKQ
jgi:hypothetical protein